ncbi:MAG TPA: hypothetical protein VFF48_09565, partial [Brevundimonas sp.]|nr:hypothetical protein [Brevundimonas sp.]
MVLPFVSRFAAPFAEAGQSPMTAALAVTRPWLRLAAFVPFAFMVMCATMVVIVIISMLVPALGERVGLLTAELDDTPVRLIEDSIRTLIFGVAVGCVALSLLAAAAITWRRPLTDFLWPGRRFDPK